MFFYKESAVLFERELQIVTDGLTLHLDAQNPSSYPGSGTTWYDLTVSGNNFTLYNGPLLYTGEYGEKSLDFDGSNDYADGQTGLPATSGQPFTLEMWVNFDTITNSRWWLAVIGAYTNGSLHWIGNNATSNQFGVWGGGQLSLNLSGSGQWLQIVNTYDGTTLKGYVNSTFQSSIAASFNFAGNSQLKIAYPLESWFNGKVGIVRTYNRALTDAEVLQNYNVLTARYNPIITIIGYTSGSSTFTTPSLTDSFEFQDNWNDTFDITTAVSGSSTFTTPSLTDSFESADGWL